MLFNLLMCKFTHIQVGHEEFAGFSLIPHSLHKQFLIIPSLIMKWGSRLRFLTQSWKWIAWKSALVKEARKRIYMFSSWIAQLNFWSKFLHFHTENQYLHIPILLQTCAGTSWNKETLRWRNDDEKISSSSPAGESLKQITYTNE